MRQYDLSLDKQCVVQGGYFRLATALAFGMRITDVNVLFFRYISYKIRYKKISIIEFNDRKIYYFPYNPPPVDCGSLALNLYQITIDDSFRQNRISHYTLICFKLPFCSSVNSVCNVKTQGKPYAIIVVLAQGFP